MNRKGTNSPSYTLMSHLSIGTCQTRVSVPSLDGRQLTVPPQRWHQGSSGATSVPPLLFYFADGPPNIFTIQPRSVKSCFSAKVLRGALLWGKSHHKSLPVRHIVTARSLTGSLGALTVPAVPAVRQGTFALPCERRKRTGMVGPQPHHFSQ